MDTENYIKKSNRQLSDKSNYKTLQTYPILQYNKMVNDTLDRFKNENPLSKKNAETLKVINPKTRKLYIHPKYTKKIIQGDLQLTQSTATLLKFRDIKDTNDYVNKISSFKVQENSFLVTMDVKALHTNIPHTKQQRYCCCQMKTRQLHKENRSYKSDNNILSTYFDTKQFHFQLKILSSNQRLCYENNMHTYIHKHIMSESEERYLYPLIKNKSSSYLRFIDDIFMVWTKSENELESFIN